MTFKEAFYFISFCLSAQNDKKTKLIIHDKLLKTNIDWDIIVKVTSKFLVLPAFYSSLKKLNLLSHLPIDLVKYMKQITSINQARNEQIILEAKNINEILISENVKPIFLKGTSNLLTGLYYKLGDRMVGDIDFLVSKKEYLKTIKILRKFGYYEANDFKYHMPHFRHYRRLKKDGCLVSVEVHKEIISEKYSKEFNYSTVKKNIIKKDNFYILSLDDKLVMSIVSDQINDNGFFLKNISLKNAYDVLLISREINTLKAIKKYEKIFVVLNCFLGVTYKIFNNSSSIKFEENKLSNNFLFDFNRMLLSAEKKNIKLILRKLYLFFEYRLNFLCKSIFLKEYRIWLLKRIFFKKEK